MSVLLNNEEGWIISHLEYLSDIYKRVLDDNKVCALAFNETIFEINSQFLRQNQIAQTVQNNTLLHNRNKKRKRSNLLSQKDLDEVSFILKM